MSYLAPPPNLRSRDVATLTPITATSLVDADGSRILQPNEISIESVGEKAFGLTCIPPKWTLPFFVVSSSLVTSCFTYSRDECSAFINSWVKHCIDAANLVGIQVDDSILVRSSAINESLRERGKFHSVPGILSKIDIAILSCIEKLSSDHELRNEKVHLVIQKELKPLSGKGHLSNERRCYKESRDWLGEFETGSSPGRVFSINLRNWRRPQKITEQYAPLTCNLKALVEKTLETAAAWAYLQKQRIHFEWVWDGQRIYLVQADRATSGGGIDPTKDPHFAQRAQVTFQPKCLVLVTKTHAKAFNKIRNVFTYLDLELPITNLYVLDNENVLLGLSNNEVPKELTDDLSELVKGSLVIRIDLATEDKNKRQLLPRTHEVRDVDQAIQFLTEKISELISKGVTEKIIFIFHNFIPAMTSAFAYAAPGQRKVLIESLWGLPEGLYYNSHDKVTVDTLNPKFDEEKRLDTTKFSLEKVPRFKNYFVSPDANGSWVTKTVAPNWDWGFSITKDEWIREIALNSRRIAEKEQRPLSIMWFIGVPKWAAKAPIFPWYHEEFDYSQIQRPRDHRRKTLFDQTLLIQTRSDVEKLRQATIDGNSLLRQVKIQPREEALLRNKALLRDVGELAKSIDAVILLEGATLSHAYYQLMQTQAVVEVIHPFEEKEEIREFNKLVRDKIPHNITSGGEKVQITKLRGEPLLKALRDKLTEEAIEVLDASGRDSILEELADVSEVIDSILVQLNAKKKELFAFQKAKRDKAGGFKEGCVLIETSNPSPNILSERDSNLNFDFDAREPEDSLLIEKSKLSSVTASVEKWSDRRSHDKANEILLNLTVPLTSEQWSADSLDFNLGDSTLRARVKGARHGAKIELELSLFTLLKQMKLDI